MGHFLLHVTGGDNASGAWYLEWSGFIPDVLLPVAFIGWWRRHACHTPRCLRWGRHPHGPYALCARHHPLVPDNGPTAEHLQEVA